MGGDDGSSISRTAKDVYSYSLHYYDDAGRSDYRPIGRAVIPAPFSNFEQVGASVTSPLYNGNIAAMGVQIDYGVGGGGQGTGLREPLLYAYRYDQLNRLVGMQAHRNLVNNQWRPVALDDYREWVSYDANGNIRSYDRNGTTTAYGTPATSHALEMDRLSYGYTEVSLNGRQVLTSNRLRHVKDQVSDAGRYTEDIDNQADDNYSYDAIGNLVRDQQGGNEEIRWTVYGKIAGINKTDGTKVYYSYDASGNRISKTVDRSGSTNPSAGVTTTWYVRDAQGNVLSTYEKRGSSPLEQTELHLYGSSRLGIQRTGGLVVEGSLVSLYTYSTETLVRGRKLYELSNHLGNVLATITDKKVLVSDGGSVGGTGGVCANGGLVEVLDVYNRDGALSSYRARQEINFYSAFESGSSDEWEGYIDAGATLCDNNNGGGGGTGSSMPAGSYYVADLVSATDYAPFGMGLVGRTYNAGAYKYGYNGKEDDKDISEGGQDYGMRIYDMRLGKFLSVDPLTKEYPWNSTYAFAENGPIENIDLDGGERKHYMLTWDEKSRIAHLTYSHTSNFKESRTTWDPTLRNPFNTKTVTSINPRVEYVVHGLVKIPYGLDGLYSSEKDATFTFSSQSEMIEAERHTAQGIDKTNIVFQFSDKWFYFNSDQWTGIAISQAAYNNLEAEFEVGGTKGMWGPSRITPPKVKAQINSRHNLNSNHIARGTKSRSTTVGPTAELSADLRQYNLGNYAKDKDGNIFINGNTYGIKNQGSTLFPIKGKNFINLTAGQIQAIQFYKSKSGEGLTKALDGANVTQSDRVFAQEFIKKY